MRIPNARLMRLLAGGGLVLAALVVPVAVSTGTASRLPLLSLRPVAAHLGQQAHVPTREAATVPRWRALLMSRLTPNALRVAPTYFAPATLSTVDRVENNALADQDWFAYPAFHSKAYENLGRVTGYYQRGDWNSTGGSATFRYQGSIMNDNATAQSAEQDTVSFVQSQFSVQASSCQTQPPTGAAQVIPYCHYLFVQGTDSQTQQGLYIENVTWAVNYCLIETSAAYPPALGGNTPTGSQIATTLSSITNAAVALAQQACVNQGGPTPTNTIPAPPAATSTRVPTATLTSTAVPTATPTSTRVPTATATKAAGPVATVTSTPTFTPLSTTSPVHVALLDVRLEKNGAAADLTRSPLRVVKVGQKILLSIYAEVTQGTPGAPISFAFEVKRGSTKLTSRKVQGTVPARLPSELRETVPIKPNGQGTFTFMGTVSAGGKSQNQSTSFTVGGTTKKQCVTIGHTRYCSW